ncbi:type II toxin-antitoxin system Phd/YefM family antitoxin [Enterococcus faecalis]|uniref:type II toxin-antitoxin system Phd/YefM family antitoxin n=1 Tax=Enterococcus faecalis TaxID=1351 RepID=UPI000A9402FA|nr:type II toxin-antitoxin system Phd/YefM family antitoxin [Enterococcus faecalis]HAP5288887.1 type II toxin-antitoxin system Phd/YefM family antitoxin [Enterococcus faecalis]HAP5509887.1 type II toxin-antitoxin system Phd/YefM family antitoxin [Enterococcus faecalis]HAP5609519.1 type II toxin-antitoxin system Phd/YefM family antitoxin [Enterococcus faecalis]
METITPTNARKNLYGLIKHVVSDSQPVEISNTTNEQESVVVISKSDWNAIQETLYLQNVGVLDRIKKFEEEETEELGEIDWDTL